MKSKKLTSSQFARLGGIASAQSKTPRQRKLLAKKAAKVRWDKFRANK